MSVIGYHQEGVVVDVEGLPVQSKVSLQSLVTQEPPPPLVPAIDDRQPRLRLLGVRHHQEDLMGGPETVSVKGRLCVAMFKETSTA